MSAVEAGAVERAVVRVVVRPEPVEPVQHSLAFGFASVEVASLCLSVQFAEPERVAN